MTGLQFYDRDGRSLDLLEWALKFADTKYQVVAQLEGAMRVSTVWIGYDMTFHRAGPPRIFETMIFTADPEDGLNERRTRYASEVDAYEGHNRTVADLQAGRTPWFLRDYLEPAEIGEL